MDEAIKALAATPAALAQLVADADDARLDDRTREGWSARAILAFFHHAEILHFRLALERILAEEHPDLPALDPAAWAERPRPAARKERLLADFALQRQASLAILRALGPAERQRRGHLGGQPLTLIGLVERWAEHDRAGIARLERAIGETLAEVLERRRRFAEEFARQLPPAH